MRCKVANRVKENKGEDKGRATESCSETMEKRVRKRQHARQSASERGRERERERRRKQRKNAKPVTETEPASGRGSDCVSFGPLGFWLSMSQSCPKRHENPCGHQIRLSIHPSQRLGFAASCYLSIIIGISDKAGSSPS